MSNFTVTIKNIKVTILRWDIPILTLIKAFSQAIILFKNWDNTKIIQLWTEKNDFRFIEIKSMDHYSKVYVHQQK